MHNFQRNPSSIPYDQEFNSQFLIRTKNRTRDYLNEMKNLKAQQQNQKEQYKRKIKQNLQLLRSATSIDPQKYQNKSVKHKYKWGHQPTKLQQNINQDCCHYGEKKDKHKSNLNSNMNHFHPDFDTNRDQILQQHKRKRMEQEQAKNKPKKKHKTKKQLKKYKKVVNGRIHDYYQNERQKQKQKEAEKLKQKQKMKQLDQLAKKQLNRSKKYDPSMSRSSFRDTIEHFSTFSEMKDGTHREKQVKKEDEYFGYEASKAKGKQQKIGIKPATHSVIPKKY